ncbi:MAG: hypothetical protein Q9220_003833 [cf. Caloplaca sp. 1 TL-2023]
MQGQDVPHDFNFVVAEVPSETDSHFTSFPWYAKLRDNPSYLAIETASRMSKHGTRNAFMNKTLRIKDTILACQSFYNKPLDPLVDPKFPVGEMVTLYSVGNGLDGHEGVIHGGFIALILDEIMGTLIRHYRPVKNPYTVSLTVEYKKFIATPSAFVCRSRFSGMEGRKMQTSGTVEDGSGRILATGQASWVDVKPRL